MTTQSWIKKKLNTQELYVRDRINDVDYYAARVIILRSDRRQFHELPDDNGMPAAMIEGIILDEDFDGMEDGRDERDRIAREYGGDDDYCAWAWDDSYDEWDHADPDNPVRIKGIWWPCDILADE